MPFDSLRDFLGALDAHGQLLRVEREVVQEPDLGAAGRAINTAFGMTAPALLFDNIAGYDDARVAMNVHGSWINHALALDLDKDATIREQFNELKRRWNRFPVAVERRDGPPWLEVKLEKRDINLFELFPVFRLNPSDGGCYIDKAAVVSRDPDDPDNFGKQNVGIYRMQVKGPTHLGLLTPIVHDLGKQIAAAANRGDTTLPIAIAVGNDPTISLLASTPLDYDQSEYEMAGALRNASCPIAAVPGTNLDVPWGAEVVMLAKVLIGQSEWEGPFGEFTGHTSGVRPLHVVEVERVYTRRKPIWEHLYLGVPWTEIDYLIALNTSVPIDGQLRAAFPEVRAVNAMYTHGLVVIISTKVRQAGFGKIVGLRCLSTPHGLGYAKLVIVVDDHIDPFDLNQVMWSLATSFHPDYDLISVPATYEVALDPSGVPPGLVTRLVMDATTPIAPDTRAQHIDPLVAPYPEYKQWMSILKELRK